MSASLNSTRRIRVLLVCVWTLLALSSATAQQLLYDSFNHSLGRYLDEKTAENGDQIRLAPATPRLIDNFTFEFWLDPAKRVGTETIQIRFYANDGPGIDATDPTPTPGTLLYDSGALLITQSGVVTHTLSHLNVRVPDTFTWSAQFSGGKISQGQVAGMLLDSPPTLGENQPEFWQKDAKSWGLFYFNAYPVDFGAEITAAAQRPVLAPIPPLTVDEGALLTVNLSATSPDPTAALTYSLISGPNGASVDPATGLLSWAPTEAQGPSTNLVTVQVADSNFPSLTDTGSFTVTVNEVNTPPALAALPNQTVAEGGTLVLSIKASDADLPPNHLTYCIVSGPAGATIDPVTGLFTWSPAPGQGTNVVTVRVTDDGTPPLSATTTFHVTVTPLPGSQPPNLTVHLDRGQLSLSWSSAAGGYHLEYTEDFHSTGGWTALSAVPVLENDEYKVMEAPSSRMRFYRLALAGN